MNTENNSVAVFHITKKGLSLAHRLKGLYPDAQVLKLISEIKAETWGKYRTLIFIMAAGIVVRKIAPLLKDKKTDPAVIVLDEKGSYAVSLLSGHLGGANEAAKDIADFLKGKAVITTASDVNNMPSIDLWARDKGLVIDEWELLPSLATKLLDNGTLSAYSDIDIVLPEVFLRTAEAAEADILITNHITINDNKKNVKGQLYMRPKNIVIGFGCNSGTTEEEITGAITDLLKKHNLAFSAIQSIATLDKKSSEPGLMAFAKKHNLNIKSFTPEELNSVSGVTKSEVVFKATGANAVAEPAALLASCAGSLLVQKQKIGNVTVAIAIMDPQSTGSSNNSKQGKIFIVGTGPGSIEHITPYAQRVIRESEAIVGYDTYLDLVKELIKDKERFSTGMTQEADRCRKAVELAQSGKTVAVISGGDPGVYAMAGLVFEVLKSNQEAISSQQSAVNSTRQEPKTIQVEVIPGISALNACAARLGAPLMHDFASISLSDRLTPWDTIEKRLEAAAMADFVIVIYNPKSKGRAAHLTRAREIILKHRTAETPVGIVRGAMRDNEEITVTDLQDLLTHEVDMQTTVIIGNSQTFVWQGHMITPRGYHIKAD